MRHSLVTVFLCATAATACAQTGSHTRVDLGRSVYGAGVTVDGKTIVAAYGKKPPWVDDAVKMVAPEYPYEERARYHEGTGVFHITLNPKTGFVTGVTVKKSTGFKTLDASAIKSFRQWRWKPGKWKELDFPVTFVMVKRRSH